MIKKKEKIKYGFVLSVIIFIVSLLINLPHSSLFANNIDDNENYIVSPYSIDEEVYTSLDEDGVISSYSAKDVIEESNHENGFDIISMDSDGRETVLGGVEEFKEAQEIIDEKSSIEKDPNESLIIRERESNPKSSKARSTRAGEYVVKLKQMVNDKNQAMYANITDLYNNNSVGISWSSSWDAAFIRTDGDYYVIKISNITAKISKNDASLVNYSENLPVSYYQASNGRFYHYTSVDMEKFNGVNQVGYQPSFIANNTKYYSYDGKYFYTDYVTMVNDYKNNRYSNAVNAENPYYNYFQHLSHRSKTNFTANQINQYVKATIKDDYSWSKLNDMGSSYISSQNVYGTNAALMFGVSVNESGWGRSSISQSKNNLFGHGAIDSDPWFGANGYDSPADSIKSHASTWVSPYSNPADWRYHGSLLGTKSSGMNVLYATDQYWGEKAASIVYGLENYCGNKNIDYGRYTIGIVNGDERIYNAANTDKLLYTTGNNKHAVNNQSVIILGEVNGQSLNGSTKWYKIASDVPINDDRKSIDNKKNYDYNRDYAYIHSSCIETVISGSGFSSIGLRENSGNVSGFTLGMSVGDAKKLLSTYPDGKLVEFKNKNNQSVDSGILSTGMKFTLSVGGVNKDYNVLINADVNGDGQILANDYFIIKKYKENSYSLDGVYLKAADVNNDGKVLANDYFMIKKYKEGQYEIAQ